MCRWKSGFDAWQEFESAASAKGFTSELIGDHVWPHMGAVQSGRRWRECMSGKKERVLSLSDAIKAMNFVDEFQPLYFACNATGHKAPEQKSREDALTDIQRGMTSLAKSVQTALGDIESQLGRLHRQDEVEEGVVTKRGRNPVMRFSIDASGGIDHD